MILQTQREAVIKLAHEKVKAVIVFLTIFAVVGGVSWALVSAQQIPTQTQEQPDQPQVMPKSTLHEDIRDAVMAYIGANHPEAQQLMGDLNWTGGRATPENLLGAETYAFQSQGWNLTLHYPVIPNPVSDITVDYSSASGAMGIPYRVIWGGIWENGCITEISYCFAQ